MKYATWLFIALTLVWSPVTASNAAEDLRIISLDNGLADEIADAAEENKRLIVMFVEDNCPWCHKMRERVFPDPRVQAYYLEKFVIIEQDIKGSLELTSPDGVEMTQKKFAQIMRVRGTPTFVYYDLKGKVAARITGYQDADTFVATGRYAFEEIKKTGKSLVRWHMEQ